MTDPDLELMRGGGGGGFLSLILPLSFLLQFFLFFLPNNVSLSLDPPLRFKLSIKIHKVSTAILLCTCYY